MGMQSVPKRIGRPPLDDISIPINGIAYLYDGAYKRFWWIPGSRPARFFEGSEMFYYPKARRVGIRPAIYDKQKNLKVTPLTRGYKMKLKDFMNQNHIVLIKGFKAKIERRRGLLVFEIPADCIDNL